MHPVSVHVDVRVPQSSSNRIAKFCLVVGFTTRGIMNCGSTAILHSASTLSVEAHVGTQSTANSRPGVQCPNKGSSRSFWRVRQGSRVNEWDAID